MAPAKRPGLTMQMRIYIRIHMFQPPPHLPLPSMAILHLLAAYTFLLVPILSVRGTRRTGRAVAAGDGRSRLRMYRGAILGQGALLMVLAALVAWGRVPPAEVGLGRPYSWPTCLAGTACIAALLVWSGLLLRARAPSVRERLRRRPRVLIPTTNTERVWFTVMGFIAGLTEEVFCRGFVFLYVRLWFPGIPLWGLVLLTSAGFGFAHLYQGARGILSTGIGGIVLGLAYVVSGNLLLPVVMHGFINARIAFLPAERDTPPEGPGAPGSSSKIGDMGLWTSHHVPCYAEPDPSRIPHHPVREQDHDAGLR